MSNTRKKVFKISLIVLLSTIILYFLVGVIGGIIVINKVFHKRGSVDDINKESVEYNRYNYDILIDRIEYYFDSGGLKLKGYLYEVDSPKGLVVTVHGIYSQANSCDAEYQQYFVSKGYDVFAFDLTSHGASEGDNINGLYQGLYDLYNALNFIDTIDRLKGLSKILVGHSMGGYAVTTVSSLYKGSIDYVIAFSGFDNPFDTMINYSDNIKEKDLIKVFSPAFKISSLIVNGKKDSIKASSVINKNTSSTKYLIVHGEVDTAVPIKQSIYGKRNKITNPNVEYMLLIGVGHERSWIDKDGQKLYKDIKKEIKELVNEYGEDIPEDRINEIKERFDIEKMNQLNEELFNRIDEFLSK